MKNIEPYGMWLMEKQAKELENDGFRDDRFDPPTLLIGRDISVFQ